MNSKDLNKINNFLDNFEVNIPKELLQMTKVSKVKQNKNNDNSNNNSNDNISPYLNYNDNNNDYNESDSQKYVYSKAKNNNFEAKKPEKTRINSKSNNVVNSKDKHSYENVYSKELKEIPSEGQRDRNLTANDNNNSINNNNVQDINDVEIKTNKKTFEELLNEQLQQDSNAIPDENDLKNKPKKNFHSYKNRPKIDERLIFKPENNTGTSKYKYYSQNFDKKFGTGEEKPLIIEEPSYNKKLKSKPKPKTKHSSMSGISDNKSSLVRNNPSVNSSTNFGTKPNVNSNNNALNKGNYEQKELNPDNITISSSYNNNNNNSNNNKIVILNKVADNNNKRGFNIAKADQQTVNTKQQIQTNSSKVEFRGPTNSNNNNTNQDKSQLKSTDENFKFTFSQNIKNKKEKDKDNNKENVNLSAQGDIAKIQMQSNKTKIVKTSIEDLPIKSAYISNNTIKNNLNNANEDDLFALLQPIKRPKEIEELMKNQFGNKNNLNDYDDAEEEDENPEKDENKYEDNEHIGNISKGSNEEISRTNDYLKENNVKISQNKKNNSKKLNESKKESLSTQIDYMSINNIINNINAMNINAKTKIEIDDSKIEEADQDYSDDKNNKYESDNNEKDSDEDAVEAEPEEIDRDEYSNNEAENHYNQILNEFDYLNPEKNTIEKMKQSNYNPIKPSNNQEESIINSKNSKNNSKVVKNQVDEEDDDDDRIIKKYNLRKIQEKPKDNEDNYNNTNYNNNNSNHNNSNIYYQSNVNKNNEEDESEVLKVSEVKHPQSIINKYFKHNIQAKKVTENTNNANNTNNNNNNNLKNQVKNDLTQNNNNTVNSSGLPLEIQNKINEKVKELENQINQFKTENEKVSKIKNEYTRLNKELKTEISKFEETKDTQLKEFNSWKDAETKKIEKEKKMHARNIKAMQEMPNRKEREEIENLNKQILALKEEMKLKDNRNRINETRLKKQVEELKLKNEELGKELRLMEELRIKQLAEIKNQHLNTNSTNTNNNSLSAFNQQNIPAKKKVPVNKRNKETDQLVNTHSNVNNETYSRPNEEIKNYSSNNNTVLSKQITPDKFSLNTTTGNTSVNNVNINNFNIHNTAENFKPVEFFDRTKPQNKIKFSANDEDENNDDNNSRNEINQQHYSSTINTEEIHPVFKSNKLKNQIKSIGSSSSLGLTSGVVVNNRLEGVVSNNVNVNKINSQLGNQSLNVLNKGEAYNSSNQTMNNNNNNISKPINYNKNIPPQMLNNLVSYSNNNNYYYNSNITQQVPTKIDVINQNNSNLKKQINNNNFHVEVYKDNNTNTNISDSKELSFEQELEKYDMIFPEIYHGDQNKNAHLVKQDMTIEGKMIRLFDNGRREITFPSGVKKDIYPDGYTIVFFTNNDIKQIYSDGKVVYFFAETNTTQTTLTDETQIFRFASGQIEKHYPNMTKEIILPNGVRKYIEADGYEETFFPDGRIAKEDNSGVKTITYENGVKLTMFLDGTKLQEFPNGLVERIYPDGRVEKIK